MSKPMRIIFILFLAVFCSSHSQALSPIFPGDELSGEDKRLLVDKLYIVPKCKRLLIVDIHNLNSEYWLEIDGLLEVSPSGRDDAMSHYMRGKFSYSTGKPVQRLLAIVHPESKVVVKTTTDKTGIDVREYSYLDSTGECSENS